MDDLVLEKLNLNVWGSNFGVYPTPPLSPLSFQVFEGDYFPPTDREVRIVDRQHDALKLLMNGNLVRKIRNPRSVLDLGTGKGSWAVEVAQELPTADEVVGVDIEALAPATYPPNCRFETADVCKGIRYPEKYFSFAHSRSMMSVVRDWPGYLAEIFRVTAPGGHVQLTEMSTVLTSGTGKLRNDSSLKVMERALQKHASLNHLDVNIGSKLSALVEAAGFHSVEEKVVEIPIGAWQPDAILDKVGTMMLEHMSEEIGIQARSCMIEIRVPEDGVDLYIEKIRQELRDLRLQLSVKAYASRTYLFKSRWYVTAKKPGRSRSSSPKGSHSPKGVGKSPPSSPKRI